MRKIFFFSLLFLSASVYASSNIEEIQAKLKKMPERGREFTKVRLYSQLGDLLYKQGKMEDAAQAYESALKNDPWKSLKRHIYLYLGKSYESSGHIDKTISAYEMSVKLDRKNWRRYRDLGLMYEQTQNYRRALACYAGALKRSPKEPAVFLAMGRVWRKLGLYPEALPWLNQTIEANYRVEEAQAELSLVFEGQGRFLEAAHACQKSLTADSDFSAKARLVYLAALGGDKKLAAEGRKMLAKAPRDTVSFYENLVELLGLRAADIRPSRTDDPNLQSMLRTLGAAQQGKAQ